MARPIHLEENEDCLQVHVRWRGLSNSEDTLEPLQRVYEDVPAMVKRLLARKSILKSLVIKAESALGLS